jgi:hypothetical protein
VKFSLEYRCADPALSGVWGPFDSRSEASDFATVLAQPNSVFVTVMMKDPGSYPFSEDD